MLRKLNKLFILCFMLQVKFYFFVNLITLHYGKGETREIEF
jgi:hypothetical protein